MPTLEEKQEKYCDWFRSQIESIGQVELSLHRKLLCVSLLDALATVLTPTGRNKEQFLALVGTCGGWELQDRISLPQAALRVDDDNEERYSAAFKAELHARLERWAFGNVLRLDQDPMADDLLAHAQNTDDQNLVGACSHLELLYSYRCSLVHDFREPGDGWDVTGPRDEAPYYMGSSDLDAGTDTWELTYPTSFFLRLVSSAIDGLEQELASRKIDPYAAYEFGSIWRHKPRARPVQLLELCKGALRFHAKNGQDFEATVNRLFHEYCPKGPQIQESRMGLTIEKWSIADVAKTVRRHQNAQPKYDEESCPPVVVHYEETDYLIDGNNRVNKWVAAADGLRRSVIIIAP